MKNIVQPSLQNLYVAESGPADAPTIVFLHGGGVSGWMWQPQLAACADYHCLVPDLPEHGRSQGAGPFTIPSSAALIAELIRQRAHGGKAHVVGLSLGAQVAVALLSQAPETAFSAMINSALLRPIPGAGLITPGLIRASYKWFVAPFKESDGWIRLNMKYSAGVPDAYYPAFKQDFQRLSADSFAHEIMENQGFRLPDGLERARLPVLIVVGQKEYQAMKQSGRDLASALPDARLCTVRRSGKTSLSSEHNWSLTAPELFNRTLRAWLGGKPLPEELLPLPE